MSEDKNVQELLRKGIEAAREGNKAEAREFLQQVVDLDDKSEKGWFWLASVVETDEERRVCLANVLFINPNNERAKKAMDQLEAKSKKKQGDEEVIPGVSRRQLMLFAGGGAGVILLIVVIFSAIVGGRNAQIAAETQAVINQTEVAGASTAQAAATGAAQTAVSAAETQAQVAKVSPTPTITPTSGRATLPPESSPTPTPTEQVSPSPLPPPDPNLQGKIAAWSGRDTSQTGFLPVGVFSMNGQFTQLSDAGRNPDFKPDGQKVMYTRYFPVTFDTGIEEINVNATEPLLVSKGLQVTKTQMPSYCATQNQIAFVALPLDTKVGSLESSDDSQLPYQVYILNLDSKDPKRVTNDKSRYSNPALSPDCTKVAAIKTDLAGTETGTDVVVIDLTSLTQTPITTDKANYVESTPRWSPDGTQLLYAAYVAGQPANNDIVIRPADGSGTPNLLVRDPSDDKYPVFSPDGQYIAFASNRGGTYQIYILNQRGGQLAQLTNNDGDNYPGSWGK